MLGKKSIRFSLYLARGLPVAVTAAVRATHESEDTEMTYVIPLSRKSEGCDPLHSLESIPDHYLRMCHGGYLQGLAYRWIVQFQRTEPN